MCRGSLRLGWLPVVGLAVLGVRSVTVAQEHGRSTAPDLDRIKELVDQLGTAAQARAARESLLRIGKPALPALLGVIHRNGKVTSSKRTRQALRVVGRLGPVAHAALPALIEALGAARDESFLDVMHAIADLVPYSEYQGDPRLVERLVYGNEEMVQRFSGRGRRGLSNDRQRFQYELNRLQQRTLVDPKAGLAAMIAEVQRNRTHRREVAAEVLGRMGPPAKSALPALAQAMGKDAPVIGQIGGFSVPKHRDEFPRAASEAMIRIAPHDPYTSIAWGWRLENGDTEDDRVNAALRIGSFGAEAAGEVEILVRVLREGSPRLRHEVITALGMIGPPAKSAADALEKLAAGADKADAARAAAALRRISPK